MVNGVWIVMNASIRGKKANIVMSSVLEKNADHNAHVVASNKVKNVRST